MSDPLEIHTLGGLEIRRNGVPVTGFATRKAKALLVFLAYTGKPHAREMLAEMLWEERSQRQSLTNLRATLSRLNQNLAPFLDATQQTLGINLQADVRVDAIDFQKRISSLLAERSRLSGILARKLDVELKLYRGDFLAGFNVNDSLGFEEWQSSERERLRTQTIAAYDVLVDYYLEYAKPSIGATLAARLTQIDPLREESHQKLMTALSRSGRRAAALAQYESCRRILANELEVEPEQATTDLYYRIQANRYMITATRQPKTLPVEATQFIGRQSELAQIARYLDDLDCRLLSLVGPGGMGKTRLAYQTAAAYKEMFAGGACIISLAGIAAPQYLLPAIVEQLCPIVSDGIDLKSHLIGYLREKELLLVLDNCEQVLDNIGLVTDLLANGPRVKILATSRERLNLQGEWLLAIEGLPYPQENDLADLKTNPAVELFVERARRVNPGFDATDELPAIGEVCRLVEGMPLAIELAAGWANQMPCRMIADQIQRDLDFLTVRFRDIPVRHLSIQGMFDQSFKLLSEIEKTVFMKLSVFRGSFDNHAAEHICDASLNILSMLVEKSLVRGSPSGRYGLHELIRQYAEKQAGEEISTIRDRHLDYFVSWTEQANVKLHGPQQLVWFNRIETEHDNLRSALKWAIDTGQAELALRVAVALYWFWFRRGYWREGNDWLTSVLTLTVGFQSELQAMALVYNAILSGRLGNYAQAMKNSSAAVALASQFQYRGALAMLTFQRTFLIADYEQAKELLEEAVILASEVNGEVLDDALFFYGDRARKHGDLAKAEELYNECLMLAQGKQNRDRMILPLGNLGRVALARGDFKLAKARFHESLEIAREMGNPGSIADWLIQLGKVTLYLGDLQEANWNLLEALALYRDVGNREGISYTTGLLANLALHRGEEVNAFQLLLESLDFYAQLPHVEHLETRESLVDRLMIAAELAAVHGDSNLALRQLGAADALHKRIDYLFDPFQSAAFKQIVERLYGLVGEEAAAALWEDGTRMSEDVVVKTTRDYIRTRLSGKE